MERIPSPSEIQQAIAALQQRSESTAWVTLAGFSMERSVEELTKLLEWRTRRMSDPRCLLCGSTGVEAIPFHGESVHPETGERIVIWESEEFHYQDEWDGLYSEEGLVICGLQ